MSEEDAAKSLLGSLRTFLTPRGFHYAGHQTFLAERADVFLMVELQRGTGVPGDALAVALNLGVFSLPLWERARAAGLCESGGGIHGSHWRVRLGPPSSGGRPAWWRLSEAGDAALAAELTAALEREGLPALEEVSSLARLRALWETGRAPGLTDRQRREYLSLLD